MTSQFDAQAQDWDAQTYRVERARTVAQAITDAVPLKAGSRVLDFGCGTGLLGFHFAHAHQVTFADTSSGMLAEVARKAQLGNVTSFRTLDLEHEKLHADYDLIVSLMTMHHIENLEPVLVDLLGHVAAGGHVCLADLDVEDGSFHHPELVPHNGIDRNWLAALMTREGFEVHHSRTVFVNQKVIDDEVREYTVFLISGKHAH